MLLDFWWTTSGKSVKTAFYVRRETARAKPFFEKTAVFLKCQTLAKNFIQVCQRSILPARRTYSSKIFLIEKPSFSKFNSNFCAKNFQILAWSFPQGCQNCNLPMRKNRCGKGDHCQREEIVLRRSKFREKNLNFVYFWTFDEQFLAILSKLRFTCAGKGVE